MKLSDLLSLYAVRPQLAAMEDIARRKNAPATFCEGLHASAAAMVFAALQVRLHANLKNNCPTLLFVADDEETAGYFYHDLIQLLGEADVFFYPSMFKRAVKYGQRDAANDILRTEVLDRLASQNPAGTCIVTFPAALATRVAAKADMAAKTIVIEEEGHYDLTALEERLLEFGFKRKDYVYEPGDFAVRGSILDVYSFASEFPFRIDFFGDDVDSIRSFEVQTQLSKERLQAVTIVPDVGATGGDNVAFTDYLPESSLVITREPEYIRDVINNIYNEGFTREAAMSGEWAAYEGERDTDALQADLPTPQAEPDKAKLLVKGDEIYDRLRAFPNFLLAQGTTPAAAKIQFHTTPQPIFHKNFDLVQRAFSDYLDQNYTIYITADSRKQQQRLADILAEKGGNTTFTPVDQTLHAGFSDEDLRICCFTDHQIFDRYHKYSLRSDHARDAKMALTLNELLQFHPGDYIVHLDHGVGRFAGLVRVPAADGSQQEMIKLTYQHDDIVLVSIHALHKLSKYKGREGTPPHLSRLGTGAWEKMKDRTKKKIKDIARNLIKLYSQRKEEKGYAFSADSFLQQELEASFTYEDTPDQLKVTQEVKADMESLRPMDRLVCGDVGFGKTEIAVRAALKAAVDNKQVAVLVPTTVLALQHYRTFAERLKGFPVRVAYLSRAKSAKETKSILHDLAEGHINIIVGTHKLIGKTVRFQDLGLLIIDEEQKFGVAVKERLRELKVNVDTLTMSATPIPRTLQFSLMGARDLSVIQTPPPNRRPIQTEIHTFNHEIIAEAVNFEMSRNGQVFIVTNRVASLGGLKALVEKYVPDARVVVGHGQMAPAELEKIILDFVNYDYDVLISTTIVENGIDIPNANTILIDAAHTFGLSDLHQMRGRVGRSSQKAFCYLLAPPLSVLKDDARRRLQAIEEFSDLGSGIHIAMQDLDIRGAGNLLGAEQSGFIADLGYETYQKILAEAVSELKSEEFADLYADSLRKTNLTGDFFVDECNVECDLHAFFPETYVPGATERMMLYRELDGLTTDDQLAAFRKRMEDRFGKLPPEGDELLAIVPLRRSGRKLGAEKITLKQRRMTLYFISKTDSPFYKSATFDRLISFATTNFRRCELKESGGKRRMIIKDIGSVGQALNLLQSLTGN